MNLQQIMSKTRQALDAYELIEPNDKIAIGISGGKDSLALLYSLATIQKFYPIPFQVIAITIDLGFSDMDYTPISGLCKMLNVPYDIVQTEIKNIVFDVRKEKNPCSLCAKLRKGALNDAAKKHGCNKIALAHHKDDFIETMLLSLFYEGYFSVFPPKKYWEKADLTVIRPFVYLSEKDIIGFQNKTPLPIVKNSCPADGNTKRESIKQLLATIAKENPGAKERMFHAITVSWDNHSTYY